MAKRKLIVVGNGMAGARAVEEVLARGGADLFDIVVFGDEPYGNYNRIMLSCLLDGSQDRDGILINPIGWYAENGIALHAGERVVDIDRYAKVVTSESGRRERYDTLVIATGSRAFIPPMKGVHGPDGRLKTGVFGYRTVDDTEAMIAYARGCRRAVTIGGGLLGLEAARGLKMLGLDSHVVHLSGHLMEMQLDAPSGGMLKAAMVGMGIEVHLGRMTTEVLGEPAVTGLGFKDGSVLDCDMVVVSAGIRPNSELGIRAGLTVERAIVVDDHMRSVDDPDIYVVGECAQHRGKVYGLVAPLYDMARVVADHVTGRDDQAAYHGSKLATKLKVSGIDLASMGITEPANEHDEVVQFMEPKRGTYKKLILRDGRLVGGILMGDISKAAYLIQAFDRDSPLPEERLSVLFDLGAPAAEVTFEEMPAGMQVCSCNGVTKAAIGAAIRAGHETPVAVMAATRGGMGCGSCRSAIAGLVAWYAEAPAEEDPSDHYYVPTIPLNRPQLVKAVREKGLRSVASVIRELGGDIDDPVAKPALASLLIGVWAGEYEDEPGARLAGERVQADLRQDGTFSIVPDLPGGICTPEELRRIADIAIKHAVPLVKLTGDQRIDLVGIPKEKLPAVWDDLGIRAG